VLRTQALRDFTLYFLKLLARAEKRLLQPIDLGRQLRLGQFAPFDPLAGFVQHKDEAAANAGGHRDAPENSFALLQPLGHAGGIAVAAGFEKQFLRKLCEN
jgi:hypothetical protein